MGSRDPRIDQYMAKAPEFARPILAHLREVVHGACPEVEETMKWSTPHFTHKGPLCHMAAFKQHAAFNLWLGSRVVGKMAARWMTRWASSVALRNWRTCLANGN